MINSLFCWLFYQLLIESHHCVVLSASHIPGTGMDVLRMRLLWLCSDTTVLSETGLKSCRKEVSSSCPIQK